MAATSRRRSTHGLTSSGSSTQLARRGSSSRLGGARGRFDPGLMMSSNAASSNGTHDDEHTPDDDSTAHDKAASRRNKSTDRLPRSRENSSTHLSNKRSKSYTHLGITADDATNARRRKAASKKGKSQRNEAEDGWTSASADNTASDRDNNDSAGSSPADEGLLMGIKKRPANLKQISTTTTLPEPKKESFPQQPDTPRASAKMLEPEAAAAAATTEPSSSKPVRPPANLSREDTSRTLVDHREEPSAPLDDAAPSGSQQASSSHGTPGVASLDQSMSSLKLDTPETSSDKPPARTASSLSLNPSIPTRRHRVSSNASNRTLRSSMPLVSSPSSVRSKSSVLSNRFPLFSRETQSVAPPMLDTHNALAGRLGARHEDRGDLLSPLPGPGRTGRSVSAMTSSTSAPLGLDQLPSGSLDSRSNTLHKAGSSKTLHSHVASPSPLSSTQSAFGTRGHASQQRASDSTDDRRKTPSSQSLTAADAAKLAAKLRLARDSMDDHGLGGYGTTSRGAQAYNPRLEKYKKPVVSTFVKDSTTEAPQAVEVAANSVYSKMFAQAHDSDGSEGRRMIRYVMGYGISGPPIEKSNLSDALLGPNLDMSDFESSWAPALAYAAGLGAAVTPVQTEYGLVAPEAAAAGGPNSTPLHLIHGLTTTSPDPFPLDPTDVPALQQENDVFDSHPVGANSIQLVDPTLIRAIAITTHAIAIHRSHVVTRRYADPMREGLERVVRSSGRYIPASKSGNSIPNSPYVARWGRKTAPNSPAREARPGFQQRTSDAGHMTASSTLYSLVDVAEHPVRSLKRVWSGGVARGGLAALTRTEEEP